ncbi:hypothetical protein CMU89_00330 [Elizabethkingia anophelis]|uniref:hypothetical protein n=1 Tax=Elizabethkingia anophelis TaxID=1117645 RepID=UPI000994B050|nr:hypothetical protein [Elizabethkingia anophelis]AQW94781.1 hypothetical protein BBD30_11635 [Elizabethkingia anophelis]MCL1690447.1 hypothetical protein [Elizabethkingia anophelis]MDV3508478.1 hypothetical protein [Elizabethkingia anophelis]MDV3541120.1 hypothetical protein [Elizabethkingia anophelis]MDV4009974.1 hypothetical protein [Elizabethkingia anophelis]
MEKGKYPLVYIEWEDSYSVPQQWHTEDEMTGILADESFTVKQTGFVLKETDTFIVLANLLNELSLSEDQYSGLHRIPKGCLIKKVELNPIS